MDRAARLRELLGIDLPILQAPMAGVQGHALSIAVSSAGGLGAIPFGMLAPAEMRRELAQHRSATNAPVNVNFFCHAPPPEDPARIDAWKRALAPYYEELGVDPDA